MVLTKPSDDCPKTAPALGSLMSSAAVSHERLVRKLQDALGTTICAALEDSSVVEVMLNPDGQLFVERLGQGSSSRVSWRQAPPKSSLAA